MLNWPKLFPKWKSKIGGWWPNFRARQRTLNIPQRPILAATCHPCAKISQRLGLCRLYLDLRGAVGRGGGPSEPAWKQQWDSVCLHLAGFSPLSTSRLDFYLSSFCLGWVFLFFKFSLRDISTELDWQESSTCGWQKSESVQTQRWTTFTLSSLKYPQTVLT